LICGCIAGHAGVGKATVYRWWPTKGGALVIEALSAGLATPPLTKTGDLPQDLTSAGMLARVIARVRNVRAAAASRRWQSRTSMT
jgi:hypothetical protein